MYHLNVFRKATESALTGGSIKSSIKRSTASESPLLLIRLVVPKISVPTILDSRFTQYIGKRTEVIIDPSKIIRTHRELPFNVLECDDVPMDRLEAFMVIMSKMINCKDIDPDVQLKYNYKSELYLRTKLLVPTPLVAYLKKTYDDFKYFQKNKWLFVESLKSDKETALHIDIRSQSLVLESLKPHLLKYQQARKTFAYESFDTIDEDVSIFPFRSVLEILKNKIIIEHQTGCSIDVPTYHDRYHMDELLEVHVKGVDKFNTAKGLRTLELYRKYDS